MYKTTLRYVNVHKMHLTYRYLISYSKNLLYGRSFLWHPAFSGENPHTIQSIPQKTGSFNGKARTNPAVCRTGMDKTFMRCIRRKLDSFAYRHYNAKESKKKEASILWITNYCRYKTEPAASTARSVPNTCCCKWRTNTTLQGCSGNWMPCVGKLRIHFCWLLSPWKIGTMTCRLGPHRPRGAGRASAAGQRIRWRGWSRLCRASADSIL